MKLLVFNHLYFPHFKLNQRRSTNINLHLFLITLTTSLVKGMNKDINYVSDYKNLYYHRIMPTFIPAVRLQDGHRKKTMFISLFMPLSELYLVYSYYKIIFILTLVWLVMIHQNSGHQTSSALPSLYHIFYHHRIISSPEQALKLVYS